MVYVATATILLGSTALVGRSVVKLLKVDPGFDPDHLVTMQVNASGARYADSATVRQYHQRLLEAPDQDLYAWITDREATPAEWDGELMRRIKQFRFEAFAIRGDDNGG